MKSGDTYAFSYQFAKRFWKGEIPADEEAHWAEGRLDHVMRGMGRRSKVWTLEMPSSGPMKFSPQYSKERAARLAYRAWGAMIPEVLLLIPAQYLPLIINVIGNVMELVLVRFHYCPWHYAYPELLCQLLISV